jgi:hypothetical protein
MMMDGAFMSPSAYGNPEKGGQQTEKVSPFTGY